MTHSFADTPARRVAAATPAADGPAETAAAVLFDLDGLLVDSEPVWYEVESAVVDRLGAVWGPQHQAACIGGTLDASCRYILALTGAPLTVGELERLLLDEMAARFTEDLPVHEGALELVDAVRDRGVATGLVSSSYRVLVDAALRRLDPRRFDVTLAGDEVSRGKPDPEPYATACARLDAAPGRCVVLEDAAHGVSSAEAAGCPVVAVPSVASIDTAPRRWVVATLTDIDVDWLLSRPAATRPRSL